MSYRLFMNQCKCFKLLFDNAVSIKGDAMKPILFFMLLIFLISGCHSPGQKKVKLVHESKPLIRINQQLVAPPFLPEHDQIAQGGPKIIQVRLVAEEKKIDIGNGTTIQAMTYNGSIPGPAIVVHQGDYVELTLVNPTSNTMLHNIDFHAATGALGGGELTKIKPGQQMMLRFKATKPGVFVYHCATGGLMIPYHVTSGMNGVIMVLPRDGLKDAQGNPVRYDRAYYIGEQDFYLARDENGAYQQYHSPHEALGDTLSVMRQLVPSHVVFNGAVGALTNDHAIKAKVGEKVLFIHSQANRDTRPHLIGGHGDLVWERGSFSDPPATNLETWFIRGGSAGAMLYEFKQPGSYVYLNHNLIEAVLLGAAAHIQVAGEWDDDLMTQLKAPYPITMQDSASGKLK
jgi:nitrite reductase (NO-forming)